MAKLELGNFCSLTETPTCNSQVPYDFFLGSYIVQSLYLTFCPCLLLVYSFNFLSQEREVQVTSSNGEVTIAKVRVWNETVSNLTLMALGSSAPEILLSVIEVHHKHVHMQTYRQCTHSNTFTCKHTDNAHTQTRI